MVGSLGGGWLEIEVCPVAVETTYSIEREAES
jgi:hypothetical protein